MSDQHVDHGTSSIVRHGRWVVYLLLEVDLDDKLLNLSCHDSIRSIILHIKILCPMHPHRVLSI